MPALNTGDPFPELAVDLVGGGRLTLPRDLAGGYAVVLFYRGSWCPYCNAQLAAFARARDALLAIGVDVVALSVDDEPTAAALAEKLRLPFRVGHSADPDALAAATGAFVNDDPKYVQSTGFVLDSAGAVLTAVYSTGAIGRLVPEDVIGFVRYVRSHEEAAPAPSAADR